MARRRTAARCASTRETSASRSSASTSACWSRGRSMSLYHWEADQEDFLVVSGDALLLVEGEERPLARLGLRPLPGRHEAHDRGSGGRAVRDRRRSAHASSRSPTTGADTCPTRRRRVIARASGKRRATRRRRTTQIGQPRDRTLRRLAAGITGDELGLDLVGDDGRLARRARRGRATPSARGTRRCRASPCVHRDAVDLLLEPLGQLPLHVADTDDGRDLLPVENLHSRHGGRRLTRPGNTGASHVARLRAAACLAA